MTTGIGPLMVALGRPRLLLGWNVTELVVYAVMIALLAQYGLTWVSIGVAVFGIASMVVAQGIVMPRVINFSILDFWRDVRAGVIGAAVALPILIACRIVLVDSGLPTLLVLLALGVVGTAVYAALLRVVFGDVWDDLLALIGRVLGWKRLRPDEPAGA
jgi:hypothetical protein